MVSILDGIGSTKWPCFDLEASAKSPGEHLKVGVCNISLKNNILVLHYLNELVLKCFFPNYFVFVFTFILQGECNCIYLYRCISDSTYLRFNQREIVVQLRYLPFFTKK